MQAKIKKLRAKYCKLNSYLSKNNRLEKPNKHTRKITEGEIEKMKKEKLN